MYTNTSVYAYPIYDKGLQYIHDLQQVINKIRDLDNSHGNFNPKFK